MAGAHTNQSSVLGKASRPSTSTGTSSGATAALSRSRFAAQARA